MVRRSALPHALSVSANVAIAVPGYRCLPGPSRKDVLNLANCAGSDVRATPDREKVQSHSPGRQAPAPVISLPPLSSSNGETSGLTERATTVFRVSVGESQPVAIQRDSVDSGGGERRARVHLVVTAARTVLSEPETSVPAKEARPLLTLPVLFSPLLPPRARSNTS